MNKKELYLKTADYLEANPHLFDFDISEVPECGSPGCILGTMAMLEGVKAGESVFDFEQEYFDGFGGFLIHEMLPVSLGIGSINSVDHVVITLRKLAEQEPDEKPELTTWDKCAWKPNEVAA